MERLPDGTEEELQDLLHDLAGDALMLELCLYCRDGPVSPMPAQAWDNLLFRASSYLSQHTADLIALHRRFTRAGSRPEGK